MTGERRLEPITATILKSCSVCDAVYTWSNIGCGTRRDSYRMKSPPEPLAGVAGVPVGRGRSRTYRPRHSALAARLVMRPWPARATAADA